MNTFWGMKFFVDIFFVEPGGYHKSGREERSGTVV